MSGVCLDRIEVILPSSVSPENGEEHNRLGPAAAAGGGCRHFSGRLLHGGAEEARSAGVLEGGRGRGRWAVFGHRQVSGRRRQTVTCL